MSTAADFLARSSLFGILDERDCHEIARQMRPARFDQGQLIFSRGDPGRDIYLVTEGRVRLSVLTPEGRELSFTHAGTGDIFGEIATLDGGFRTADATAVAATHTLTLSSGALNRLIEDNAKIARAAIAFLCARLRDADEQLEVIALHPIEVRLARFLLTSIRAQEPPQKTPAGRILVRTGLSQSELALRIGASRPKVNVALTMLESVGAIARSGNAFECDVEVLEDLAERD